MQETEGDQPAVQLRIGFTLPQDPLAVSLTLNGMLVSLRCTRGSEESAYQHLLSVGVQARPTAGRGVEFPVRDMRLLTGLPDYVTVEGADSDVRTLLDAVRYSKPGEPPIVARLDSFDSLNLTWEREGVVLNEPLSLPAARALIGLGIPVVTHDGTWEGLLQSSVLPPVTARARINLDGFIEIAASVPQIVEMSPIPALFRLDETRFGVPLCREKDVHATPGIVWEGASPLNDPPPRRVVNVPLSLSGHTEADLRELVENLARYRGQVVCWPRGSGRRMLCAAAVESLEAYPLLIVTNASGLWPWQRNFEALRRDISLRDSRAPVRVVTYDELREGAEIKFAPTAIVLDDIDIPSMSRTAALRQLHSLDGLSDAVRIACVTSMPEDLNHALALMSLVRPVEFRPDLPALVRYPPVSATRAREHIDCYVLARSSSGPSHAFYRRSGVDVLPCPEALAADLASLSAGTDPAPTRAEACLEAVSGGSFSSLSPKISAALEYLRVGKAHGERTAVLTVHERTARILHSLSSGLGSRLYRSPESPQSDLAVILLGQSPPALTDYQHVVFVDYPLSGIYIDGAAGPAWGDSGPLSTVVLHLDHPFDTRMAVVSAARRESGRLDGLAVSGPRGVSAVEASYILGE